MAGVASNIVKLASGCGSDRPMAGWTWGSWCWHSSAVPGRDWKRLAARVVRGRIDAGYRTRPQFAEALNISERTIGNLERGTSVSDNTLIAVERLLGWRPGSVDDILDRQGEPVMANGSDIALTPPVEDLDDGALTFDVALEAYGKALLQLRRVATTDPNVPAKALGIIEDWEMMYTAMVYGGVDAVLRAIADSYRKGLPGEGSRGQTG